jgi:hypothetical protein
VSIEANTSGGHQANDDAGLRAGGLSTLAEQDLCLWCRPLASLTLRTTRSRYRDSGGDAMYRTKITWRIQLPLSDDPRSRALFHETLADQPVSAVRLIPCGTGEAEITGEVIVELAQNEGLGVLLDALHVLSPRVFVSCADSLVSPAAN